MKEKEPSTLINNPATPRAPERRRVLNWIWVTICSLAFIELIWLTISLLKSRLVRLQKQRATLIVDAGLVSDMEPGSVKPFPIGQFYLSRLEDGSFLALSHTCTHLGCSVPWNEEKGLFICPCHGSTFDRTGTVRSAPATRPLDYYTVKIENGLVRVDVSRPLKRQTYDHSQTARS